MITRPKLLLLLAYLALEGPQTRRDLALLFWNNTQDPMLGLRLALKDLRKIPGLVETSRDQVCSKLKSDVDDFENHLLQGNISQALELYKGSFLAGLTINLSYDLETWLIETRENLAQKVVLCLLGQAETSAQAGYYDQALQQTQKAFYLKDAPAIQGLNLKRFYRLFRATDSALADKLEFDFPDEVLALSLTSARAELSAPKTKKRAENPYRGLLAFREEDSEYFFGRDQEIAELLERIQEPPYSLCIIGNSGAGKSSLVFAGLLPHLRQKGYHLLSLRPGRNPFMAFATSLLQNLNPQQAINLQEARSLASSIQKANLELAPLLHQFLPKASKVLIFVDQLEELFSLNKSSTISHFLRFLLPDNPRPYCYTVFTLRADYLSILLAHPPILPLMRSSQYLLGPMSTEALQYVIVEPAKKQHAEFEAGLSQRILKDLEGQQNSLPLLAFSLMQIWDKQEGQLLKHETYEAIGGIEQALVRHAENCFDRLTLKEQNQAHRIFLQLVSPGLGQPDSKRVAYAYEVKAYWPLIHKLASYPDRLLVIGLDDQGEFVELIHEALIEHWSRLRAWLDTYRSFRIWQERFRQTFYLWEKQNQDPALLLQAYLLQEAEQQLNSYPDLLSDAEASFIRQSLNVREQALEQAALQNQQSLETLEQLAEQERHLRESNSKRLKTQTIFIRWLSLVGFLAIFFSLYALNARNTALNSNLNLIAQRERNQDLLAELLSEKASINQAQFPEQSLLLALEASSLARTDATQRTTEAILQQIVAATAGIRLAHQNRVLAADFSPDGAYFVTGGKDAQLSVWHLEDSLEQSLAKPLRILKAHEKDISSVHFSSDGKWLLSSSFDHSIRIWDASKLPDLSLLQSLNEHSAAVLSAQFSPDSRWLVAGSRDNQLSLWQLKDDWQLAVKSPDLGAAVQTVRFSPEGRYIAAGINKEQGQVLIWEDYHLPEPQQLELNAAVRSLAFSPDTHYLAVGDDKGQISLFTLNDLLAHPLVLKEHKDLIAGLSFSPNHTWLASSSRDKTIKLWFLEDLRAQQTLRSLTLRGHEDKLAEGLAFSKDGRYLLSTAWDNSARLIDMAYPGADLSTLPLHFPARSLALDASMKQLAVGDLAGNVHIFNPKDLSQKSQHLGSHDSWVEQMSFNHEASQLVSGSDASKGAKHAVLIWNLTDPDAPPMTLPDRQGTVFTAAFMPQDKTLAVAGESQEVEIWNLSQPPKRLHKPEAFEGIITDIKISNDSRFLGIIGLDKTLSLFNPQNLLEYKSYILAEELRSLAFSPDNQYLAAASWQGGAFIQQLEPLAEPQKVLADTSSSYAVAFSPDSAWFALGHEDGSISLAKSQNPENALILRGHEGIVWSLAFSPDNQWLISASSDGKLRYWYRSLETIKDLACKKAGRNLSRKEWQQIFRNEPYRESCTFE